MLVAILVIITIHTLSDCLIQDLQLFNDEVNEGGRWLVDCCVVVFSFLLIIVFAEKKRLVFHWKNAKEMTIYTYEEIIFHHL